MSYSPDGYFLPLSPHASSKFKIHLSPILKIIFEMGFSDPHLPVSLGHFDFRRQLRQLRRHVTASSRVPSRRAKWCGVILRASVSASPEVRSSPDDLVTSILPKLDNVSAGMTDWKGLLRDYWTRFSKYYSLTSNVTIHQVEKMLEDKRGLFVRFASKPPRPPRGPSLDAAD